MTNKTSSRSAKATPKMAEEPDINGTPPESIEPPSEATSTGVTQWILQMQGGQLYKLTVPGDGRATIGGTRGGQGEVRIYPNKSTKDYVASVSLVAALWRSDVTVELVPVPTPVAPPKKRSPWSLGATTPEYPELTSEHLEALAASIVRNAGMETEDAEEVPF